MKFKHSLDDSETSKRADRQNTSECQTCFLIISREPSDDEFL